LRLCDVFIMPARNENGDYEGFGIVYLEANVMGKPVIAGRSGGVEEAVINNYNGLLVDPLDPKDIAAKIIALMNNPDWRAKLGAQGRYRAIEECSWDSRAKRIYELISN